MNFNVLIGNPPYNRGLYTKFMLLHKIAPFGSFVIPDTWMIGEQYKEVRNALNKKISKVVYFEWSIEVFDIQSYFGIMYYLYRSDYNSRKCMIENRNTVYEEYNNTEERELSEILNNRLYRLIKRMDIGKNHVEVRQNKYIVIGTNMTSGSNLYHNYMSIIIKLKSLNDMEDSIEPIVDISDTDIEPETSKDIYLYSSDRIDECMYYISWITSNLISYIIMTSNKNLTGVISNNLYYLPECPPLDHIYSDKEIYEYYDINESDINIISKIIRPKKHKIANWAELVSNEYIKNNYLDLLIAPDLV